MPFQTLALPDLLDSSFWVRLAGISFFDLVLSGDNAVVIALAVRLLPRRQRLLGRVGGTIGAVLARLVFLGLATLILSVPLLKAIGGGVLIWIAARLVRPVTAHPEVRSSSSVREAIGIIVAADVIASLDNVLAVAAAAGGDQFLLAFGIALSIPIVIGGSGFLGALMDRFVWITWLGGGALAWVAGGLIAEDELVHQWLGPVAAGTALALPAVLGIGITALGWWLARQRSRPPSTNRGENRL